MRKQPAGKDDGQLDLFAARVPRVEDGPAGGGGCDEDAPAVTPAVATAQVTPHPVAAPGRHGVSRYYQEEAADACDDAWQTSRGALVVLCTGAGKTHLAGLCARRFLCGTDRDVLFIAHRHELLRQAHATLSEMAPLERVEYERAGDYSDTDGPRRPRIVVASKDTLWKPERLRRFGRDRFGLIVCDEAHHAARKAGTYSAIFDYFEGYRLLGLTATPRRADRAQLGQVFGAVAYTYGLQQAIRDGYLVKIVQKLVTVAGYDISGVNRTRNDLDAAELADVMRKDPVLHGVARAAIKYSCHPDRGQPGRRPTLIFCASVGHARHVAEILNNLHAAEGTGEAAAIWSSSKDAPAMKPEERASILERYADGRIRYLCNFSILTEGVDLPATRVVVVARATTSRALYTQVVGRVVRPAASVMADISRARTPAERHALIAASVKPAGVVIDLMGVSGHHKLVTAVDVLGGDYEPEVVAAVKKRAEKSGGLSDIEAALIEMRKQREAEGMLRRARAVLDVTLTEQAVDPFDEMDCPIEMAEPGWAKGRRATQKQKALLAKLGFTAGEIEGMAVWQARRWIDTAVDRRRRGLCSIAQSRILKRHGLDPDLPHDAARAALDALAARGWQR